MPSTLRGDVAVPLPPSLLDKKSILRGLVCGVVVVACVLATRPFASLGMMDDWSYIKTAQIFARTGHLVYNHWAPAMLGWQVPASALGIKLFGFTFTAARLYTLPVTLLGAWLFYLVLAGFDFSARNAAFGTFALFLSMVCLPLEFTSMTDVPGLAVVILCLFLCQRAVAARTAESTLAWLCLAAATNLAGGTVRPAAWLGAVVMVPATAWLLRRRRGVFAAGVFLALVSLVAIEVALIWFRHQPFSVATVPFRMFGAHRNHLAIIHFFAQMVRIFLSLQLLLLPLLLGWVWMAWKHGRRNRMAVLLVAALSLVTFSVLPHWGRQGQPGTWLAPFSPGVMATLGLAPPLRPEILGMPRPMPLGLRIALSALVVTSVFAMLIFLRPYLSRTALRRATRRVFQKAALAAPPRSDAVSLASGRTMFWLLGPFLLAYLACLLPLGLAETLLDRYLIPVFAVAIILLLRLYEETIAPRVQRISMAAMAVVALYAILGTHDVWALYRARVAAGNELLNAGVPRTAIQGGFEFDGLTQIETAGAIVNHGAPEIALPTECQSWFSSFTPAVHPLYFVVREPVSCFGPAHFADVWYRAWLPPFHRRVMIGKLREQYVASPDLNSDFKPLP